LLLIWVALLWNGRRYPPGSGFDYGGHRDYIEYLREHHAVPGFEVTRMAYNPPLFYMFAAATNAIADQTIGRPAKTTKFILALLACVLVWLSMECCEMILGEDSSTAFLLFLMMMPVFFKASAMLIPEQFTSVLIWIAFYIAVRSWASKKHVTMPAAILSAIFAAAAIWTRPFGFAAPAALGLAYLYFFFRDAPRRASWSRAGVVISLVCGIAGIALFSFNKHHLGTPLARPYGKPGLFKKQPLSFYLDWKPGTLFTEPVRPNLGNRWMPIFYSELWGDYWKYWSATSREESNLKAWT